MKVLVTGGTGLLGQEVVNQIVNKKHHVKILSTQCKTLLLKDAEFVKGDLALNLELNKAVEDSEIVIHCASNPKDPKNTDIKGTFNLLRAIDKNKIQHFVYISIVGVNQSAYPYYRAKYEVENMIAESGIPYSILRTTQFHNFVFNLIKQFTSGDNRGVIAIPAGMKFQSIDIKEVAEMLAQLVKSGPAGLLPDAGGPQIQTFEEMTSIYSGIYKIKGNIQAKPMEGERYDLFRSGINLCPQNALGKISWEQFLLSLSPG